MQYILRLPLQQFRLKSIAVVFVKSVILVRIE